MAEAGAWRAVDLSMVIGGRRREADGWFEVRDPATGELTGRAPNGGEAEAREAVDAAYAAFATWRKTTAHQRADLLHKWGDLLAARKEELARLITREMGKPIVESRGEVDYALGFVRLSAEDGRRLGGEILPTHHPDKRLFVLRQPAGVVACITPWNFPLGMVTRKVAPALAAGCTAVLKPAEQSPLTAIRAAELALEAGIPAGVFNVVTGDPEPIARAWLADPRVRQITFTGSTEVGKLLMRGAADTVKRVSLELGGHAPVLVFEDADPAKAAEALMQCKFRNGGQACSVANRIYAHRSLADPLSELTAERARALRVGRGLDEATQIGPLVEKSALEKVQAHVADAVAAGARVLAGGGRPGDPALAGGHFFQPTVLVDVPDRARVLREETFGPVAPIVTFADEEEAVRRANDTRYGLAAYVFTRDLARIVRVAEALEFGIVGVNDPLPAVPHVPFGGWKESGLGKEGGRWGVEEFLETKLVSVGMT